MFILLAILLVDQLDAGMMMPIYPQLFTDPKSGELLLAASKAETTGMLFVALLGAAYALPAFFAQPLLGQLADRFGRRPMLIASFASSTCSFAMFALGIHLEALWLLVFARVVDGIAAGNLLVAQAAVADLSDEQQRTRYFGYFTAALSLGIVMGPLLGGWIGDPDTGNWAGPATAFWVAGGMNLLAVAVFAYVFQETLAEEDRDEDDFELGRSLSNARAAFVDKKRRPYYLILFAYLAGYTFLTSFLSVVLEEKLDLEPREIGHYFAALGLALMLVQLLLVERVEHWVGPRRSLWLAMFCGRSSDGHHGSGAEFGGGLRGHSALCSWGWHHRPAHHVATESLGYRRSAGAYTRRAGQCGFGGAHSATLFGRSTRSRRSRYMRRGGGRRRDGRRRIASAALTVRG